jgi:hypothetical protein
LSAVCAATVFAQSALHPVELPLVAAAEGKVLPIPKDGEVSVDAPLVKRLEIGKNSAVVSYLNKTSEPMKPDFSVRIFNNYGMEIAVFRQHWLLDTIAPGAVHKENAAFVIGDLAPVFAFTGIKLPADWDKPAFAIVGGKVF